MKKTGNICDFSHERDQALLAAFRDTLSHSATMNMDQIAEAVAVHPAERFYVSEERAVKVMSALLRGEDALCGMHPSKRRMYQEIHRRLLILHQANPKASVMSMVIEVIYSRAPEFYMSPRYVKDCLSRARTRNRALRHG